MSELSRADARATFASLPNLLTYGRIAAVPAMAASLFFLDGPLAHWLAAGLFAAASITDYFDGYLARMLKQQSELGRMLDPIADKLLVATALIMLVHDGVVTGWAIWAAVTILAREIAVSGLREFLAELQVRLHVTKFAKWKTGVQMLALVVLLASPALVGILGGWVETAGVTLLWLAAALTLYTGFDYLRAALHHLK